MLETLQDAEATLSDSFLQFMQHSMDKISVNAAIASWARASFLYISQE